MLRPRVVTLQQGVGVMKIWDDMDQRVKRFGLLETKLAQGAAMGFVLIIVKIFPCIMDLSIWWFVAFTVVCAIRPLVVFLQEA